jgi:hypothetical protein
VAVVFVTKGGEEEAPKYRSYEVAPVAGFQLKVGATVTPVAPLAGAKSTGAAGESADTSRAGHARKHPIRNQLEEIRKGMTFSETSEP